MDAYINALRNRVSGPPSPMRPLDHLMGGQNPQQAEFLNGVKQALKTANSMLDGSPEGAQAYQQVVENISQSIRKQGMIPEKVLNYVSNGAFRNNPPSSMQGDYSGIQVSDMGF